ncbi:hypothetical protein Moror_15489 [Moniliophthora roreri MCA 2997]|uniref:Uncharacterized protein n=2 Tax=Moniliophthora roreri TaxID=221103 RepID=V2WL13_MONRO|nr:hypothetical protein Moror_15489 [Moniliophthora roreri MCA 2997]
MTINLVELKKTLLNAHKFLPEKALLGVVVDNFCCKAFNSLTSLSDNDMLAVSKNRELTKLCNTVLKEVNNSSMWSIIDDQVHKSTTDNVLYIKQLVDSMHKSDKSASMEPSECSVKVNSLSKADVKDFLTENEKSSEEEPAPCIHSHGKGKEKASTKTKKHPKDLKDNMEPHKADCEACQPGQSSCSNSVPPNLLVKASVDKVLFLL